MSSMQGTDGSAGITAPIRAALRTIRESVLLSLAVVGAVLILLGYVIGYGVWAAILPTWGVALVLLGTLGYAFVWWNRR